MLFAAACTAPTFSQLRAASFSVVPPERSNEYLVTIISLTPRERASIASSERVEAWLDSFWVMHDPSPGTPENELLEILLQRADYLLNRFPSVEFGDWPEPWPTILKYGFPDKVWFEIPRRWIKTSQGDIDVLPAQTLLEYGGLRPFKVTLQDSFIISSRTWAFPRNCPRLNSSWELFSNPSSSRAEKWQAALSLQWYELPSISSRLRELPETAWDRIGDLRSDILNGLIERMLYTLSVEEVRRIQALRALRADPMTVIGWLSKGSYPKQQFSADLGRMAGSYCGSFSEGSRGPSPDLMFRGDRFLARLVDEFPSSSSLTGWDWRGELVLRYGHPTYLDEERRSALYLWYRPEWVHVTATSINQVEVQVTRDVIAEFVKEAVKEVRTRREQAAEFSNKIVNYLRHTDQSRSDLSRTEIIGGLNGIAPAPAYQVAVPELISNIPISMDAVVFNSSQDSVEVQISIGIPASALELSAAGRPQSASIRTSLVLVDEGMNVRLSEVRDVGYSVHAISNVEGGMVLDTFRMRLPVGTYVAYSSVEDPIRQRSGGVVQLLDCEGSIARGITLSPIILAASIDNEPGPQKFERSGLRILPVPTRIYGPAKTLNFYYEISGLTRSDVGDYAWQESYFIVPSAADEGVVRLSPDQVFTSLTPFQTRSIQIDFSSLSDSSHGGLYLVVVVTDHVSDASAVSATRFEYRGPAKEEEIPVNSSRAVSFHIRGME